MADTKHPIARISVPTASPRDGGFGRPGLMSAPLVELTQRLGGRLEGIEAVAARGSEVLPNLITILKMGTDHNRACALACLIKMTEEKTDCWKALPAVREAFATSKDEYVRGYAATVLGNLGDRKAPQRLAKRLGSRSHIVRWRCADALKLLGEPAVDAVVKRMDGTKNDVEMREARRVLLAIEENQPGSVPMEVMLRVSAEEAEVEKRRMGPAWKS